MAKLTAVESAVTKDVSADELWKTTSYLSGIERVSAKEGEYKAVDYLVKKLTEYGIANEVHEFDAYLSYPIRASLRVLSPVVKEIRAKTRSFGHPTPPEGLEGEAVWVESKVKGIGFQQLDNQYDTIDVKGKIVITERGGPDGVLDAMKAGAIAHVHVWPSKEDVIHEMISTSVWGTPTPESSVRIPSIPSISVNNEGGEYLHSLCGKGPVRIRLTALTDTRWTRERLPVATIPGAEEPEKYFLIGGHLDSWYVGTTDNATGNAAMLELARVLNAQRGKLRRTVKIGWWVGHSYGRYAGSTWYCDANLNDLRKNCVGYMDIDSPGVKGATIYDQITCMTENWHIAESAITDVSGGPAVRERPPRAGDYSFYGPGLPSMFMLMGNRPTADRFAVGGSGLGWWWHSEYDTLEWADKDVLAQDTKIYALAILRVANSVVLPYRHTPVADELLETMKSIDGEVAGRFDFKPVFAAMEALKKAAQAADVAIPSIPAEKAAAVNKHILTVERTLIPINYTRCGAFDHDPAHFVPALPLLDDARKLAKLDPKSNDYGFLLTRLVRSRNLVLAGLETATEALQAIAAA